MKSHFVIRLAAPIAVAALVAAALVPVAADPAHAATGQLGAVEDVVVDGDVYTFTSGEAVLQIEVPDEDLLRVRLAPDGELTDPANDPPDDPEAPSAPIIVKDDYVGGGSELTETDEAYLISTDSSVLTVTKDPITLAMSDAGGTVLWRETEPLRWDSGGTTQTLEQGDQEQFFGGGMQNGRFSHRDSAITISRDFNWNDGGNPNAAPFYLSSNGYGVFRNTFAPGSYDFHAPVRTTHSEERFDAWYFVGDTREVVDGYTELTGRPLMVPMYALEVGDADCYLHNANRGERETLRDSRAVADGYVENDMPLGWMLVNDGYGCGYEDLPETAEMLQDRGAELGLWTEADLTDQEYEVSNGVRVRKTDVAWVGPGYRFALSACEDSRAGIEDNSDDRAFVLTVEGWAGTQRCGATWSGDQAGSWEYIRWQIPTYAGATLSGQHLATGDIDGIFGGSADTYTRDLQWKMLLPNTYSMSGWAADDKQPYRYGPRHTEINADYLQLHERLLPYLYTHTAQASMTGLGATRPLYVNYPDDPTTWGEAVQYEFLSGDDLLVAPVYEDSTVRDGIYLPEGTWVDYWTGRIYEGPQTIDGYPAPLERLPMFVRAGAIIPMFAEGTLDWAEGLASGQLDLDIYPQGQSAFTRYEDDGRTQAWRDGESATQEFTVDAPEQGAGPVTVTLGALDGSYDGMPDERTYQLTVHTDREPGSVRLGNQRLSESDGPENLTEPGWTYDDARGVVLIRTPALSTSDQVSIRINGAGAVGGTHAQERDVDVSLTVPTISSPEATDVAQVSITNQSGADLRLDEVSLDLPEGWQAHVEDVSAIELADGESAVVEAGLTPDGAAEPGSYELTAAVAYQVRSNSYRLEAKASTTLAFADLAGAFNNVGVTAEADPAPGDIDGGGSSFLAERLVEQGVQPGAELTYGDFTFAWPDSEPGTADNVAAHQQTIRLSGQGNALALLGTGTSGSAGGTAVVHYADGGSEEVEVGFPNWCCLDVDSYGAQIAATTLGKNTPTGPAYPTTEYRLYTVAAPIDPDREVAAVTLPGNSTVHVFAMAVGTTEFAQAPIEDGQYTLTDAGTGLNLQAPGTDSAQLLTADPSAAASQKWILTRSPGDGSYEVRNAGSGQCMDVFYSSGDVGALVGQYACTGTSNQRFDVEVTDDGIALFARHSGLSIGVDDAGAVVQVSQAHSWQASVA
ncbi:RICIN domain-containing protein [Ruania alkalisoli]|uniref:RICIN domain-containing protein n=1 Tax=Ruania alkalisoli TaxID=2779775 RepID=A0A7M1SQY3_9MICO|nr:TIM-barrel domain-containing protein [Ruania alkalisoli]QOR69875.1 RICIN domain-containing protein [Ruania alkalisoli]